MKLVKSLLFIIAFINALLVNAQITVSGVVNHASPSSTANVGNITLNVNGGTSPYTYMWTPGGATTKDLTGVTRNNYSVKVKDAVGDSVLYPFSLGYKTNWLNINDLIFRNDSILYGFGVSKNTLLANNDGWAEVIFSSTTSHFHFGFTDSLGLNNNPNDIDYGFYFGYGVIFYSFNSSWGVVASSNIGDVIRIERVDTIFNLKLNGNIIASATMPKTKNFKLKAIAYSESQANIGASFIDSTNVYFANYVKDSPIITHCNPGLNNGSITLTPKPSGASHTYLWSHGSYTTSAVSSLSVSAYAVKVKDSDLNESYQKYNIGYKTKWKDLYGLTQRNDSLIYGYAISKNTLLSNSDGWAEFIVPTSSSNFLFGLTDSLSKYPNFYDVDFGIYSDHGNAYYVYGTYFGLASYVRAGDLIRIERIDTTFNIKVNNDIVSTQTISKDKNFKLQTVIYTDPLANIGASFMDSTGINFPNYLRDYCVVRHCTPGQADGSIILTPKIIGETHTYTLSPGSYTSNPATGLISDIYTVATKDTDSNKNDQFFNVAYKTNFTNLNGLLQRNDSLIPTLGYHTATSKNTLKSGQDGWAEILFNGSANTYYLGFTDSLSADPSTISDIDFGFFKASNTYVYGIYQGQFTPLLVLFPNKGDIFRVERTDTLFSIKQNGITIYSGGMPRDKNYKLKTVSYDTLCNVGASFIDSTNINFSGYVRNVPLIKHSSGLYINDGSIQLFSKYGDSGHTYTWTTTGENSSSIADKAKGNYNVIIADTLGNTSSANYDILFKTKWTDLDSCIFRNDSIMNIYGYSGWSTAASKNSLMANKDGEISWVVDNISSYRYTGFADTLSAVSGDMNDIDQGLYESVGALYYFANGYYYLVYYPSIGDVIKIKRKIDTVSFYADNILLYSTICLNKAVDWKVKTAIYPGNSISNVGCSFNTSFQVSINKEHADYLSPVNGSGTVIPYGGVIPYKSVWNDSLVSPYRSDLYPGTYTVVSYADSTLDSEVIGQVINIGTKPYWQIKKNSESDLDSVWVNNTDSLGVLVSANMIDKIVSGEFEIKANNTNQDMAFGFFGSTINVTFFDSLVTDSVLSFKTNLAYSLVRKAIHDSLTYTPDGTLDLNDNYMNIHLIRIHNGQIQILFKDNAVTNVFGYTNNDFIKIGRSAVDGKIFIARNDTVLYRHPLNVSNQYFHAAILAKNNSLVSKKGIVISGDPVSLLPAVPKVYAVLKRKLDGGFYSTVANKLLFLTEGEYNQAGLKFNIYDKSHTAVLTNLIIGANINSNVQYLGDNRYTLYFPGLASGYYILEVINEKKEKTYLRFWHSLIASQTNCPTCNPN